MDRSASRAQPARRRPLTDASLRANANNAPMQDDKRKYITSTPTHRLPHNASFIGDGSLAVHHGIVLPQSPDNKRVSTLSKEDGPDSKRNSAISDASTIASNPPARRRWKRTIGPWNLGATVGTGGTSRVRLVRHFQTGQKAVVKIISKHDADRLRAVSMAHLAAGDLALRGCGIIPFGLEREIVIMKLLNHKNIVKLYDLWENHNEMYIIMEYIEGGELFNWIMEGLDEKHVVYLFRQIIAALMYCHRLHIHHRDLKPENVLIDSRTMEIKLVDFGMAALQAPGKRLTTACGSPHYAAPELLSRNPYYDGGKIDVWSCGVMLFVMLTGTLPFNVSLETHSTTLENRQLQALFKKIKACDYVIPPYVNREARDLLLKMLQVDPKRRISIDEVWHHPFLHKYDQEFGTDPRMDSGLTGPKMKIKDWKSLSRDEIDRELLRNLKCLWHSESEEVLIEKLLSRDANFEKFFYSALLKHREEYEEDFAGLIDYSSSDYHHYKPSAQRGAPPLPGQEIQRSKSAYSILNDEHLQSLHSLYEPPPSEVSYDPFRASRNPVTKSSKQYMNVTVHREASNSGRALKPPSFNRSQQGSLRVEALRRGSQRSSHMSNSSASLHGSTKQRLSSAHRLSAKAPSNQRMPGQRHSASQSRSSIASSAWASSPPTSVIKPNTLHKRGVQFSHLRKSSTASALTSKSRRQSLDGTANKPDAEKPLYKDSNIELLAPTSSPPSKSHGELRSRKENKSPAPPQLRIRRAKDPSREVDKEARKVSAELEKFCQEAFYRSSVSSSNRSSATEKQVGACHDTPPSSVSHQSPNKIPGPAKLSHRPLPPIPTSSSETPKTFTARELVETRNRIAARFAEANGENADYFRDVLSHLDTLLPPSMQDDHGRRVVSAPQPTPKHLDDLGYLPVISEESRLADVEDHERIGDPSKKSIDYRAITTPANLKPGEKFDHGQGVGTIRLVEASSPTPIAPLNIRKKSSSSTMTRMTMLPSHQYHAEETTGTVNRRPGARTEIPDFAIYADTDAAIPSSPPPTSTPTTAVPVSSSTAIEAPPAAKTKKRGWFRRITSEVKEDSIDSPATPTAGTPSNRLTKKTKQKSLSRPWDDLDDRITIQPPARPNFTSKNSDAALSEISEFPLRATESEKYESAPTKGEDAVRKALRKLFWRSKAEKEKEKHVKVEHGLCIGSPGDFSSSSLGGPLYEVAPSSATGRGAAPLPETQPTNWLARFLHIKPARKVLCFQVGRGRVRQEMVRLLRDWKRFGVRDVAFDRVTNIVSWRIDKVNHLSIKPVTIVAELFVVLEHGRRAQLAIVRFTQTRGAASSFRKVVDTLEEVMGAKGLLVEDEDKKAEMTQILA